MPLAVFVTGAPGTGKSTVGRGLARRTRSALLDGDDIHGSIKPLLADADPARVRAALYGSLLDGACGCLQAGLDVVVVAPYRDERRDAAAWRRIVDRCADAGGRAALVWVRLQPDVMMKRLSERGADRDADKLADPERYIAHAGPEVPPVVEHLVVDGGDDPEVSLPVLIEALGLVPRT